MIQPRFRDVGGVNEAARRQAKATSTAHGGEDGSLAHHTLRSSLWLKTSQGWQMRYHQGTPATQPW